MTIFEISKLQPHQQRVVAERDSLLANANALSAFINGDVFPTVDSAEQARLVRQNQLQFELVSVLNQRISYFTNLVSR